ncbi:hypothetical protein BZL43_17180 [Pseudomonas sp. PICF141]|nr:hypothetical protein BZL43_17180 [Pseudomonas sp. PICF141]
MRIMLTCETLWRGGLPPFERAAVADFFGAAAQPNGGKPPRHSGFSPLNFHPVQTTAARRCTNRSTYSSAGECRISRGVPT